MFSSISNLHELYYSFIHLLLLVVSALIRTNIFSLIYGIAWLFQVGFYPHPLLLRRLVVTKIFTTVTTVAAFLTIVAQVVLQILFAIDPNVYPADSSTASILKYFGWIQFTEVGPSILALLPDILVFCSGCYLCLLFFVPRWSDLLFVFSMEQIRTAYHRLRTHRASEILLTITLLLFLLAGVAAPSVLSIYYLLIFLTGCLSLIFSRSFSQLLLHSRGWLWAISLGYCIFNIAVLYVLQFKFIYEDLTLQDLQILGVHIFVKSQGNTPAWPYIVDYIGLCLLFVTLAYWSRRQFASMKEPGFQQFDQLDGIAKRHSSAAHSHLIPAGLALPTDPSGSDSDADSLEESIDVLPAAAPHHTHPAAVELPPTAATSRSSLPDLLFDLGPEPSAQVQPSLLVSLCARHGWKLAYLLLLFISISIPTLLTLVFLLIFCASTILPLRWTLKLLPLTFAYSVTLVLALFVYNLPFEYVSPDDTSTLELLDNIGLVRLPYPFPFLFVLGLACFVLSLSWALTSAFIEYCRQMGTPYEADYRYSAREVVSQASPVAPFNAGTPAAPIPAADPAATEVSYWLQFKNYLASISAAVIRFFLTLLQWFVEFISAAAYSIALGGLFVCALTSISYLNAGYMLFFTVFVLYPKIADRYWLLLVIYSECVILAIVIWQLTWTLPYDPQVLLVGLKHYNSFAHHFTADNSTWQIWVGLFWHIVILVFALLAHWIRHGTRFQIVAPQPGAATAAPESDEEVGIESPDREHKFQFFDPSSSINNLSELLYRFSAKYGLFFVYLTLLLVGFLDTLSFCTIIYVLLLFIFSIVHVALPGRAIRVISKSWLFPLTVVLCVFLIRYVYQFAPVSDAIIAAYPKDAPFTLEDLGLVNYFSFYNQDSLFPAEVIGSLIGNGVIFVLFSVMLHIFLRDFSHSPPFSDFLHDYLNRIIAWFVRLTVLHAHKALLLALFLSAIGNINIFNMFYMFLAIFSVTTKHGPSAFFLAVPFTIFATLKVLAQMFFRLSYFLSLDTHQALALWFGFDPSQSVWNAAIGDVLITGCFAISRLSQYWLADAKAKSLQAQGLTQINDSSSEPCSLFQTGTHGIFDDSYQEMAHVNFFRSPTHDSFTSRATPGGFTLILDSCLWYLSNFFSFHGYHLFLLVLTIQVFVRLDILSFFGILYLGLSGLISAQTLIRQLPFVLGWLMFTIALQYIFLLGLPPVGTLVWPWIGVISFNDQLWLALNFDRWELVADFFVLFIAALIVRAASFFQPILDAQARKAVQTHAEMLPSPPDRLSVRLAGSINSQSSDSEGEDQLGRPNEFQSEDNSQQRDLELQAKFASHNRHWLNTVKYYTCASSIPLCLFFVFLAGTAGLDILSVGYVIFALYYSYHASWVASTGMNSWVWVQFYNYCVLFLQVIYQISYIPASHSPWLTAFGFEKMIVFLSPTTYTNIAFTSHGVVFDILIFFILAIQSRLFKTQTFQDVHYYIRNRIRLQEAKKRALWSRIQKRDVEEFIEIEHNESMSRNRLIAVKRLRAAGKTIVESTEESPDLQHSFTSSRPHVRRTFLPYVSSKVTVTEDLNVDAHRMEPTFTADDHDDGDRLFSAPSSSSQPTSEIILMPVAMPSNPSYQASSSPPPQELIIIPDTSDDPEPTLNDIPSEPQYPPQPGHQDAMGPKQSVDLQESSQDEYSSPFLPPKGPKPPQPSIWIQLNQLITLLCDWVYLKAKYRDRDPEIHSRFQGLFIGLFSMFLNHSYLIAYLMMVIDMIVNSSILSLFYPIVLFGYAIIEYPMPPSKFWKTSIVYISAVLILKVVLNIPGWLQNNTAKIPWWVGIPHLKDETTFLSGSVVSDLLLWLVLLWHRSILKSLGLWRTASEFRKAATIYTHERYAYRQEKLKRQQQIVVLAVEPQLPDSSPALSSLVPPKAPTASYVAHAYPTLASIKASPVDPSENQNNVTSLLSQLGQKLLFYFKTIVRRQSPTSDYYTHILILDLVSFIFIAIFPHSFTGLPQRDLPDAILNNRIPRAYLGILFFQFFAIIWERIVYLLKSSTIKLMTQYVLLILYHAVLFGVLPYYNQRPFYQDASLIVYYLLKCLYFFWSGKQLRRGYPPFYDQGRFSVDPNLWNYFIQNVYTTIPFLWEARALLDWTFTPTTLTFFYWMNLEDIYTVLWIAAYNKWSRNFGDRVRGESQPLWIKILLGVGGFVILIFIIWLPLFLLSSANPSNSPNPVYASSIQVSIRGWNPLYIMDQEQNIIQVSGKQFNQLASQYGILNDQKQETQVLSLLNYSQTLWSLSPPSRANLIATLNDNNKNVTMVFSYTFVRHHPVGSLSLSGSYSSVLPQQSQTALATILTNEFSPYNPNNASFIAPGLFPRVLHLPVASQITLPYTNTYVDAKITYRRDIEYFTQAIGNVTQKVVEWWEVTQINDATDLAQGFNASGPQLVLISDSVPTGFTASIASAGIIVLYTGIVFSIARFIRTWLTAGYANIPYEQMPEPDRIRRLCEDIYAARQFLDLNLEEELYWELIELYRSPERMIEVTQPFSQKQKQD